MTDEIRPVPIRSVDPVVRIGLGLVVALLGLIASFTISAHFAGNDLSRQEKAANDALHAFCVRFRVACVPTPPAVPVATTTTTSGQPAPLSKAPSPTTVRPRPAAAHAPTKAGRSTVAPHLSTVPTTSRPSAAPPATSTTSCAVNVCPQIPASVPASLRPACCL